MQTACLRAILTKSQFSQWSLWASSEDAKLLTSVEKIVETADGDKEHWLFSGPPATV